MERYGDRVCKNMDREGRNMARERERMSSVNVSSYRRVPDPFSSLVTRHADHNLTPLSNNKDALDNVVSVHQAEECRRERQRVADESRELSLIRLVWQHAKDSRHGSVPLLAAVHEVHLVVLAGDLDHLQRHGFRGSL